MEDLMREHRRTLVAGLFALAGLGLVIFRLTSFSEVFLVRATWAMADFQVAIYYPVVAFLSGINPYAAERFLELYPVADQFPLYPPATFVVHMPFGLLWPRTAFSAYFLFTLALTFLLGYASLTFNKLEVRTTDVLLIGGLILLSRPGHWNLLLGQPTLQIVLASYVALYFAKHFPIVSGLGLTISMIKPTFGIPIALLMLAQRHVRPVLYGGAITALINVPLVVVLAYREQGFGLLGGVLVKNFHTFQQLPYINPATSTIRIDAIAFISHFIGDPLDNITKVIIAVLILGIAGWTLARIARLHDERFWTLAAGIACLAVLLSVYHQAYDLLLLVLPFVGLVGRRFPSEFYSSYRYRLSVGLLTVLAANYGSTHSIMRFVPPENGLWLILVSINSAALLTLFFIWVHAAHVLPTRGG